MNQQLPMTEAPMNPLPWVVWLLALPLIAMELVVSAGASGLAGGAGGFEWRLQALERFAYFPTLAHYSWASGGILPIEPWRMVTYLVIQGSFTSTLFAVVILLALGKMIGEIFRWWAVLVIWFGAAIVGALVYTLVLPGNQVPLIGAFPAAYGLIGAFTFLLWVRLAGAGTNRYRAFQMIGLLMGVQLVFGLFFGGGYGWIAEFSGFGAGFLLSFLVSPGGIARVMAQLRGR